jgi:hypothetical protein
MVYVMDFIKFNIIALSFGYETIFYVLNFRKLNQVLKSFRYENWWNSNEMDW